jgi:hypothetical protein
MEGQQTRSMRHLNRTVGQEGGSICGTNSSLRPGAAWWLVMPQVALYQRNEPPQRWLYGKVGRIGLPRYAGDMQRPDAAAAGQPQHRRCRPPHMPSHFVVRGHRSSKPSRGEDVEIEQPVACR